MPRKIENLTGRVFGRLTAKKYCLIEGASCWECICACGTTCYIKHYRIVGNRTKSCGCLRRELATKDLTGKIYGKLTVVEKQGYQYQNTKDRAVVWKCQCECGGIHLVKTSLLQNGHVKSCGCLEVRKPITDLTGRIFGDVKVTKLLEVKNRRTFWLCKCNCGKEKAIDGHHLTSGKQRSCGCKMGGWKHGLSKDKKAYYRYLMSDPIRKLRHSVSKAVRKALNSKKSCSVTKHLPYTVVELKLYLESLWEPWMNWGNYGGRPNDTRKTWWIDHIIPQCRFPYKTMNEPLFLDCWKLSNLRPLEKIANISKGNR